jgi:hypothetical protein
MVSFQDIQTAYYMVAATGVLVAAAYYILNIVNSNNMRKREVVMSLINTHSSYDLTRIFNSVVEEMEFKSWEDFLSKYAQGDKEAYRRFIYVWVYHDRLGYLLKESYVTPETMFVLGGYSVLFLWEKCESLDVAMKRVYGESYLPFVKYLALEMVKVKKSREPGYVIPVQFSKYLKN